MLQLFVLLIATCTATAAQGRNTLLKVRQRGKTTAARTSLLDVAEKGFISSAAGAAMGSAMGGDVATVSDRENCVGCQFIWSKVNALLDQSSGYEAVKDAFERTCANMPNVFYDVCDTMFDREDEMIQMYLNNMEFKMMCDKTQICLN
jgi:hypothetical protein